MRCVKYLLILVLTVCAWGQGRAATANMLVWQKTADASTEHVSADLHGEALWPLLEDIAHQTGWHILVEPGADRLADVKFNELAAGRSPQKAVG